jgi:DNA-binding transcriptional LysR family regulator
LPIFLVQESVARGELVRLLPEWSLPLTPLQLVYPSAKKWARCHGFSLSLRSSMWQRRRSQSD